MPRLLRSLALAVVATLALAGCGDNDATTGTSATSGRSAGSTSNEADVSFAQSMMPHHRQAVQMAKLASTRASSQAVKLLATQIEAAQGPEIATMGDWLRDWGEKVPSVARDGMAGMADDKSSAGSGAEPGMMSGADMKSLRTASGTRFDRMFLAMMIRHHAGAVTMAETEQAEGKNPDAVALAKQIERDQSAEITRMRQLL